MKYRTILLRYMLEWELQAVKLPDIKPYCDLLENIMNKAGVSVKPASFPFEFSWGKSFKLLEYPAKVGIIVIAHFFRNLIVF